MNLITYDLNMNIEAYQLIFSYGMVWENENGCQNAARRKRKQTKPSASLGLLQDHNETLFSAPYRETAAQQLQTTGSQ